LENMKQNGDTWLTITAILALLSNCDMLAAQSNGSNVRASRRPLAAEIRRT
jgi:hypothetical protein